MDQEVSRFSKKLFFEFSSQEILNIIEALTLYQKLMLPKKYRFLVDNQLQNIIQMLKLQNIDTFGSINESAYNIGEYVLIDSKQKGILLGVSDEENLLKVAIIEDSDFQIIDVPFNLIKKVENVA